MVIGRRRDTELRPRIYTASLIRFLEGQNTRVTRPDYEPTLLTSSHLLPAAQQQRPVRLPSTRATVTESITMVKTCHSPPMLFWSAFESASKTHQYRPHDKVMRVQAVDCGVKLYQSCCADLVRAGISWTDDTKPRTESPLASLSLVVVLLVQDVTPGSAAPRTTGGHCMSPFPRAVGFLSLD